MPGPKECPCGKCRRARTAETAAGLRADAWRHVCRQGHWCYQSTRHPDGVRRCDGCGQPFEPDAKLLAAARELEKSLMPNDGRN